MRKSSVRFLGQVIFDNTDITYWDCSIIGTNGYFYDFIQIFLTYFKNGLRMISRNISEETVNKLIDTISNFDYKLFVYSHLNVRSILKSSIIGTVTLKMSPYSNPKILL